MAGLISVSAAANLRRPAADRDSHRQSLKASHHRGRTGAQFVFRNLEKSERGNFTHHLIDVKIDSRLQCRENQFVTTQRAKERFAFERRNQSFLPDDDSGLWAANQFVSPKTI